MALCATAVVAFLLIKSQPEQAVSPAPAAITTEPEPLELAQNPPTGPEAELPPEIAEQEVPEMRYLPSSDLPGGGLHPMLSGAPKKSGDQRIRNARKLTTLEQHGPFLAPRWSPDGLQLIASRPGYNGVWLLGANGEDPILLSESNGYNARWTPDGKIEIPGEDGKVRRFSPDGVLEAAEALAAAAPPAYSEDDTIWVRPSDGGSPFPLTGSEDRFFNPVVSPDGRYVAYQGLNTGLYIARADGSGEPVYLGDGNNPSWLPDSSGLVFDVTRDDGHNLTEGDLYYADAGGEERTNLTEGDGLITQNVTVGPDGQRVTYEADGEIYIGELN